jgi:hypothetical protein
MLSKTPKEAQEFQIGSQTLEIKKKRKNQGKDLCAKLQMLSPKEEKDLLIEGKAHLTNK